MKKIEVTYYTSVMMDVTDEEFNDAMAQKELDRGDAFNRLVMEHAPDFHRGLSENSEIMWVNNPWMDDDFAQPEDDEVYWAN